jgi:hypothetical protein
MTMSNKFQSGTIINAKSRLQEMVALFVAMGVVSLVLSSCGSNESSLKAENEQQQSKLMALQAENDSLKAQLASQTANQSAPAGKPDTSNTTSDTATSSEGSAGPSTTKAPSFTDIAGIDGEQDIKDVAALGVLDTNGGSFDPDKPVTRATYVRWLVKTNNVYYADSDKYKIHLASANDSGTFVDLPPTDPDFKYVQGMANAGYVVGVDKTHFAPNQPITREQMIAIKVQIDQAGPTDPGDKQFTPFSDKADIDQGYVGEINEDGSVRTSNNISRIWGNIKVFHPKKSVTRAEAAVSLSKIASASYHHNSAAEVLKKASG